MYEGELANIQKIESNFIFIKWLGYGWQDTKINLSWYMAIYISSILLLKFLQIQTEEWASKLRFQEHKLYYSANIA